MSKREIAQKLNEVIEALNEVARYAFYGTESRTAPQVAKIDIPKKKKKKYSIIDSRL